MRFSNLILAAILAVSISGCGAGGESSGDAVGGTAQNNVVDHSNKVAAREVSFLDPASFDRQTSDVMSVYNKILHTEVVDENGDVLPAENDKQVVLTNVISDALQLTLDQYKSNIKNANDFFNTPFIGRDFNDDGNIDDSESVFFNVFKSHLRSYGYSLAGIEFDDIFTYGDDSNVIPWMDDRMATPEKASRTKKIVGGATVCGVGYISIDEPEINEDDGILEDKGLVFICTGKLKKVSGQ